MSASPLSRPRHLALSITVLLVFGGAVSAQDAYMNELAGQSWYHVKATAVHQPQSGEEYLMAGTDALGSELYVATIDDQGQPVASFTLQPNVQGLQISDAITYEFQGQELFAILCRSYSPECFLFIVDVQGNLHADWVYPISHPTGNQGFNAEQIAWDPDAERLAIVGNVTSFGPTHDVGLFTTDGLGEIKDEMRWYEFGVGGWFNSAETIGIAHDPWFGGFLVGARVSALGGQAGFMLFPVGHDGDPLASSTPWITKAFRAHGFSFDHTHGQVLVRGEDFAFGPGVSFRDLCFWMDDAAHIHSGTIATQEFTRFTNVDGAIEIMRDGAFGVVDPSVYSLAGLSDYQSSVTYFDVAPGAISLRSRVQAYGFGYVTDLLHLPNYTTNGAGYGLDQVIVGWTGGSLTALTRRTSSGERDPSCESKVAKIVDAHEPHDLFQPTIDVAYTFKQGGSLGTQVLATHVTPDVTCKYPGFASGTAK